jgi:phosphoribosylanthranilate isomerase
VNGMPKVKICGITNRIEIGFLNKFLPDYAGFVFAKSRRQVTPELASELGAALYDGIRKVGVFVNHEVKLAANIAEQAGLDVLQLHGDEDKDYIDELRTLLKPGVEIWKALRIDALHMPESGQLSRLDADRLLVDTYVAGSSGGTGKCFDWGLVEKLGSILPVILAGGLNPENVKQAVRQASPYAVDTSSGVELEGIKNEQKLRAFMEAVRGGRI